MKHFTRGLSLPTRYLFAALLSVAFLSGCNREMATAEKQNSNADSSTKPDGKRNLSTTKTGEPVKGVPEVSETGGNKEKPITMFNGTAELTDPNKGAVVATFNETCDDSGTALATVTLRTPITLHGTERLEIFGTKTSTPMITVGASDPNGTEIREFHGKSAIGCIPEGADLTLVKTPGGRLGTLLMVIGKGKVQRAK
jgi:hypothetical protein